MRRLPVWPSVTEADGHPNERLHGFEENSYRVSAHDFSWAVND
jgi:hypothetical protein